MRAFLFLPYLPITFPVSFNTGQFKAFLKRIRSSIYSFLADISSSVLKCPYLLSIQFLSLPVLSYYFSRSVQYRAITTPS
jgi:hypothetical protein